jgi:hypothetical protein
VTLVERARDGRGFLRHVFQQLIRGVVLLAVLLQACSGANRARDGDVPGADRDALALHRGELTDFVPAAGLRWLIAGSPAQLAREPALAPLRESWLSDERVRAFAKATGVNLLATERGLIAGFDLGTLYMADASGWIAPPERSFSERLAGTERRHESDPRIWHVTGLVGSQPEALVRVDDALVAVAVGDPALARVVELYAERRLGRVPTVFQGASLASLPEELRRPRSFAFYLLGPLDESWVQRGSALLGAAQALALTLDLEATRLRLGLFVAGRWQPAQDVPHLAQAWQAFAASSLGGRLGLDRPLAPPELSGSEALLSLLTQLDAARFQAGVEALLVGNLDDLLAERARLDDGPALLCHSSGYACTGSRRQDRPDGQLAFDVGGGAVRGTDRGSAGGGEPRGGPGVQSSRHDRRRAELGGSQ